MEDHNVNHTWMGHLNHQVNIFPCEASIKRRRVLLHPLGQPFTSSHVMRRKEVHNLWEIGRWKVQNLTTEGALEAKAEAAGIGWREKFLIENPCVHPIFFLPFLLTHASSTPFAAPESTTFFAKKLPTFPNPTIPTLLEHRPFLLVGSIV